MLAVGGTNLTLAADNTIASTGAWNDTAYPAPFTPTAGGGGGPSTFKKQPVVAARAVVHELEQAHGPRRAAFADESPGYPIVCSKGVQSCKGSGQSIAFVGGTSAATPLVAGMIALWNQQARNQGLPNPGFVAPLLYTPRPAPPAGVHRRHPGHQRPLRRLVLPDPAGLRPRHRLGLPGRERHRLVTRDHTLR